MPEDMKVENIKKNSPFLVACLITISFFLGASNVGASVFGRDLNVGDSGTDVYNLQKVLNRSSATRIAPSGAGSPGNETYYFGSLTRNAVMRFQEKYASEILHPLGLLRGTGYVGPSTIAKLNSFLGTKVTNTGPNFDESPSSNEGFQPQSNKPHIDSVTPSSGSVGTRVTLHGSGFDKEDNIIYASFAKLEGVSSEDGKTIEFEVGQPLPRELIEKLPNSRAKLIPDFVYEFMVETGQGRSNPVKFILHTDF